MSSNEYKAQSTKYIHYGPVLPSLKPKLNADPSVDVPEIYKVYRFPKDVKKLALILSERSSIQREQIKAAYWARYKSRLDNRVKGGLADSAHYCTLLLLYTASDFDALLIHGIRNSGEKDTSTIIDILCTRSFEQIGLIQNSYRKSYKKFLTTEICDDFSSPLLDLLTKLCTVPRDSNPNVDEVLAQEEATNIAPGVSQKIFVETIERLFCLRSYSQINFTFQIYNQMHGRTFYNYLKSINRNRYEGTLMTLYLFYTNTVHYFAKRLRMAIKRKDIYMLARFICSRAEVDLSTIQYDYFCRYGTYLHQDILVTFEKGHRDAAEILVKLC